MPGNRGDERISIYETSFKKELFNRVSPSYDTVSIFTSFGFARRWRRQFLSYIPANDDQIKIADLMTGRGETWRSIAQRFPNAEVTALDISTNMLRHARAKNKKLFKQPVLILEQDILSNTLPDDHYDAVVCAFGLKMLNAQQLTLLARQTKRILKTGGHFSFIETSRPEYALLRNLYRFHLEKVVPLCGLWFLGNPEDYRMLWKYTDHYSNSKQALAIFDAAGLNPTYDSYFYGCATGIHGYK